jgi:tetratricopeptide (TPR) repeat protein
MISERCSSRRCFPGWRSLTLACALLVIALQGCGPGNPAATPEEQIREGWRRYRLSEFGDALKVFESVSASQPTGSEASLQGLYGQASCWNHRRDGRDSAKAVLLYEKVIAQAPENPLASWCALDIVRAKHLAPADQERDYPALARAYGEVYQKYPETPAGEEAFVYQARLTLATADADQARKSLEEVQAFLDRHPNTPFRSPLYILMAEAFHRLNEEEKRLDYMIKAMQSREVDPRTPFFELSTAYWNIAYAAEFEAGNFAVAREYYHRLIDEFPRESRVFAARKALARMDAVEADLREGRPLPPQYLGGALQ